jgi:hypothetical protein
MEEDMYEGMYEEGYGDDNVLNKLSPEDREEKLKTQPVYSEEVNENGDEEAAIGEELINALIGGEEKYGPLSTQQIIMSAINLARKTDLHSSKIADVLDYILKDRY